MEAAARSKERLAQKDFPLRLAQSLKKTIIGLPQESSTKIHTRLEKPTSAEHSLPPPSGKVLGGDGLARCVPPSTTAGKEGVGGRAALRYLWVLEATDVRVQVELDACACSRQRQPTNQQHQQHSKRESSREIDNLQGKEGFRGALGTHLLLLLR